MHEGSEEPNTHSFYSDEDSTEVEDMQISRRRRGTTRTPSTWAAALSQSLSRWRSPL